MASRDNCLSVEFTFREKYRHDENKDSNFDASRHMADFNAIVHSIKLLPQL